MARGLGKGINAFFPDIQEKEDDTIQEIAINECRPNPYQPRKTFHADAIEELKNSILEYGIIQPLIVRKSIKGYEIVVGERRFRAAKEAGLDTVPVVIKELRSEERRVGEECRSRCWRCDWHRTHLKICEESLLRVGAQSTG